jgi:hypothetical protein
MTMIVECSTCHEMVGTRSSSSTGTAGSTILSRRSAEVELATMRVGQASNESESGPWLAFVQTVGSLARTGSKS